MANNESSPKLSQSFSTIWETYEYLETCGDPTNSEPVQAKVKSSTETANKAIEMVNQLELFSTNEDIEEVATNEIRYLLLPALLGYLTSKNTKIDRLEVLTQAQVYYTDFLKLVRLYGLTTVKIPSIKNDSKEDSQRQQSQRGPPNLDAMADERKLKIERFREQKALQSRLEGMKEVVKSDNADEDVKRDYYTTLLKHWVNYSLDELISFRDELDILEHMARMRSNPERSKEESRNASSNKPQKKPMQPFILTKDKVQAAVFGAGYKSLPTYTIEEFYDMNYGPDAENPIVPPGGNPGQGSNMPTNEADAAEKEAEEKEKKEEEDDVEALQKARNWDDWKDDHRRGWGNRQNMG